MAKRMENCLEKLSSLLDSNETHLNGEISIEHENVINASNENNSCSSTIKFEHILMSKSNRFKVKSCIKKHTSEKCNSKCTNSTQLNTHNRIHSKQKRFACAHCPKKFAQSKDLKRHKRIHTGERPYHCDL
jgi:uncharacterized Zn-finger protein